MAAERLVVPKVDEEKVVGPRVGEGAMAVEKVVAKMAHLVVGTMVVKGEMEGRVVVVRVPK